jgi:hypothetical protein
MERLRHSRLSPDQRKELESILKAHRGEPGSDPALRERFLSDYGDSTVPWIFGILLGSAGVVGSATQIGDLTGLWRLPGFWIEYGVSLHGLMFPVGFLLSLAVVVWAVVTWIGNHRRRGWATTSFATIRVKGPRLALMRHSSVTAIEWTRHRTHTQSFSVLVLTGADGKRLTCYVHAGWVRLAIDQIDRARIELKLPPIEGAARKLPE